MFKPVLYFLIGLPLISSLEIYAQELPVVTPALTEAPVAEEAAPTGRRRRSQRGPGEERTENGEPRRSWRDRFGSSGNSFSSEEREARRANRYERIKDRLNVQHRLSLDLTNAATSTASSNAAGIILEPELNSVVVKTYNDPYSGFQAYKIKTTKNGRDSYTYAFAATQVSARDANDPSKMVKALDPRDLATNAAYGLPQMESLKASELLDDVVADLRANRNVTMSGQSLGGMLSHSLGYIALRRLREANELNLRRKLKITSWGIPGVTDLIRDYMKKRLGVNEQLDPQLTDQNFESLYYDIDLLPKVGQHFGRIIKIDEDYVTPNENENFAMNVPGLQKIFEAHVNPGFVRALEREGVDYQGELLCPEERGFRLTEPLQRLSRYFSRLYLDNRYKVYLTDNGTEEDWQKCYESPTWSTNLNRRCTLKSQRGCTVKERAASRQENRGKANWCLPEINPLNNARFRAPAQR